MSAPDVVRSQTVVAVAPAEAFRIFTEDVDRWWRRGPRFRFGSGEEGELRFEPGVGGRLVEIHDPRTGRGFEVGRILQWKPPERLVFEFRARSFAPGQVTEVEVRFTAEGAGTRVEVEHRGWEALAADHPVRHGLTGTAFRAMMGVFWGDLLVSLRGRAGGQARP